MKTASVRKNEGSFTLLGSLLFVLILVLACHSEPPYHSRPAQAQRGKVLFEDHCATCHVKKDHPMLDTMEVEPPDLTRIMARRNATEFPVLEVARIIDGRKLVEAHGPREMPVWGDVFKREEDLDETGIKGKIGELVAYLMTIQVEE